MRASDGQAGAARELGPLLMAAAPPGAVVGMYVDGVAIEPGDAIHTRTGRAYGVLHVRPQLRGKHVGRQHLRCLVLDELPTEARRIWTLNWYPRR